MNSTSVNQNKIVSGRGLILALATIVMFLRHDAAAGQVPVFLGSAGKFAVLAGSTVTSTGGTTVTGDLGVWAGTAVTGFAAIPPGGPGTVNGTIHSGDTVAQAAEGDLTTAYNDAAGRTLNPVDVANADLGGRTLAPGLYKSSGTLAVTGNLTLDAQGDPNAVFIFQITSSLNTASGSQVILSGGASAANIYWQVGSSATLGTTTRFKGNILADQSISLATGATLDGRALARIAAVTLDANTISAPASSTGPSWTMWWQRTDGRTAVWLMNGTNATLMPRLNAPLAGPGWRMVGEGDFNKDGHTDLLWQHADGSLGLWLMDGTNCTSHMRWSTYPVGPGWTVVGTGDFIGDGETDILWQSTDGWVGLWLMDGTNLTAHLRLNVSPISPGWKIVGTGDFDGNGSTDILWQHTDGWVGLWLMNRTNVIQTMRLNSSPVDSRWSIVGSADLKGTGQSDILWQRDTGTTAYWLMNGTNFISSGHFLPDNSDPAWKVVGPR